MSEPTLADKINTVDGNNPATVEPNGLLIPWEVFDELEVSAPNRDKADVIVVALAKLISRNYPPADRATDFNVSLTATLEIGTIDRQFDDSNNELLFDNHIFTLNMYSVTAPISLDPDVFAPVTTP